MSAFKPDLQRVLAHQGYVLYSKLFVWKGLDPRKPAGGAGLTPTLRARAGPTEALTPVCADVAALPLDLHHLLGAIDVDRDGERVWLFQWTLITGSWR